MCVSALPGSAGGSGGLAVVFKNQHKCSAITVNNFSRFEVLMLKITKATPGLCVGIYRPPKVNPVFLAEFSEFLSSVILKSDKMILVGDF